MNKAKKAFKVLLSTDNSIIKSDMINVLRKEMNKAEEEIIDLLDENKQLHEMLNDAIKTLNETSVTVKSLAAQVKERAE